MAPTDNITLLNETENTLIDRQDATTDSEEQTVLVQLIQDVCDLRQKASFENLVETRVSLNDLTKIIEMATASLRKAPFGSILGDYQSLLDRISEITCETSKPAKSEATGEEFVIVANRATPTESTSSAMDDAATTQALFRMVDPPPPFKKYADTELHFPRQIDRV